MYLSDSLTICGLTCTSGQRHGGLPERIVEDLDLSPRHRPPAQPERLHHGLLGREPRGEPLAANTPVSGALGLRGGEDAADEALAPPRERLLDARHFHDIDANSKDDHPGLERTSIHAGRHPAHARKYDRPVDKYEGVKTRRPSDQETF